MFHEVIARAGRALRKATSGFLPNFEMARTLIYNGMWAILAGKEGKVVDPYQQNPTVFRAVNEYGRRLSQCPVRFYTGTEKNRTEVEAPKWSNLFDDPNPQLTRAGLIAATMTYKLTDGECLWLLEGRENVADMPDEIYPVSPYGWEKEIDEKSGQVITYKYPRVGKSPLILPFWQVVSFRYFNPKSKHGGLSPLVCLSRSLQTDLDAENVNQAFLENGAEPGGVLQAEGDMDDAQVKQMVDRWEARHGGTSRRGRIAALWGGMKYQPIPFSHQSMEYLAQRRYAREEVAMAFSIPWEILGFGKATFDNYEQAERSFWQNVLKPEANELAEIISERIVTPASGGRIWADLDTSDIPAMQDDVQDRIVAAKDLWGMGVPLEEVNRVLRLGLDVTKVKSAKTGFLPLAIQTVDEAVAPVDDYQTPDGGLASRPRQFDFEPDDGQKTTDEMVTEAADRVVASVFKGRRRPVLVEKKDRWAYADRVEKAVGNHQRRMRQKVRRVFMSQRADILGALASAPGMKKAEAPGLTLEEMEDVLLEASRNWDRQLIAQLMPEITATMKTSGDDLSREMDWSAFDTRNPEAAAFMEGKPLKLAEINRVTVEKIRSSFAEGIGLGESVRQLQERVRTTFNQMTPARSLMIARTESGEAANAGRQVVMRANGVKRIEWVTAHDDRVRDSHAAIDGDVIDMGERFDNGLRYPQDPEGPPEEVINCRCVAAPVIVEGQEV